MPKAVIVVNLYGLSAKMDKIMVICNTYHVPVIEDAAESLGTYYKGKQIGHSVIMVSFPSMAIRLLPHLAEGC